MPVKKKETEEETITVSDDEIVRVNGPKTKEWPDGGSSRSYTVATDKYYAYIKEKEGHYDLSKEEDDSFTKEKVKEKLSEVVKDTSAIEWRVSKKYNKGVDMGPTNDILKDILEMAESCQKTLTSMALKAKRTEKKGA